MDPPSHSRRSQKRSPHSAHGAANGQSDSEASSNPYSDSGSELAVMVATIRSIHHSQVTEEFNNTQETPPLFQGSLQGCSPARTPDAAPPSSCDPDSTSNPYSDSGSVRSLIDKIKGFEASQTAQELRNHFLLPRTRRKLEDSLGKSTDGNTSEGAEDHSKDSEDSCVSSAYHPSPTQVAFSPPSPADEPTLIPSIIRGMYWMRTLADHH